MKTEEMKPFRYDENGVFWANPNCDAASDDWIRAGRLKEKARRGDKAAAKELAEFEGTPMIRTTGEYPQHTVFPRK